MKPRHTLVACAVAAALTAGVASADTKLFAPPTLLATGSTPRVVLRVDVEGGGPADDLVTANEGTNDLTVFVNNGYGGYYRSLRVPTGLRPGRLNAIDLDNDGRTDLAVLNQGDATVQLLLNDGHGSYRTVNRLPVGANPDRLLTWKAGTLSRLAVSNAGENTITYYAFAADGAVIGTKTIGVGRRPNAIQNIDLDADGVDELVVVNFDDGSLSIVEREDTAAALPTGVVGTLHVGKGPIVTSGAIDLDGDGRRDLVVANRDDGTISVLTSRGNRTFNVATYRVGALPGSVNAVDLDGDAKPDLVVGNNGESTVSVLMNRGSGMFDAPVEYRVGRGASFAVANDVDGDGAIDLVVPSTEDGVVSILRGVGDGTFNETLRVPLPSAATPRGSAQLVDVNGDGNLGVAVALPGTHQVALIPNRMDGYVRLVEFTRKAADGSNRYFITSTKTEIEALDTGAIEGWRRTGGSFRAYARAGSDRAPVCRFYSAAFGTHFFTSNDAECNVLAKEQGDVWTLESRSAFYASTTSAAGCAGGTTPIYRLFDPVHVTHRNTASKAQRDALVGGGWIAEGDGPDGAAMCAP